MPEINDNSGESYQSAAINRTTSVIDTFSNGSAHSRKGNSTDEINAAAQSK